jgi:hypothetical protein
MPCNKPDCSLCKIDREGCQCRARDVGCWYCAPNKFNRPECSDEHQDFLAYKKTLYDQIEAEIQKNVVHFAVKSGRLQDHIYEKQEKILAATTKVEADKIYERLMGWVIHADAIFLWGKGKAKGPPHKRTSDIAAKKAEQLAAMLDEKGDEEGAQSQRDRAARIRKELSEAVDQ